ncbi:hypothetical protein CTEN210_16901 [Chaetoceros tenuissimus]|uniref:Methyltransferase type 11 domain-containing protein n=1 Tax=Chaetoceros tenuissimus TaxID=426638 RepID=A0AAD3HE88_9STRA|nr:hypothetical protein CTEN210_16901 [Chaetoceros tenuissimus]
MSKFESVRAYANLLQTELNVTCDACALYNAGYEQAKRIPSSLVTVEPFCPGGKRRLVLNVNHPLIKEIAKAATSTSEKKRGDAIEIGKVMIVSASWPTAGLDVFLPSDQFHWKSAKGLICGPHTNYITPVLHEEVTTDANIKSLAIYPRKIQSIRLFRDKANPSRISEMHRISRGELWHRRDLLLQKAWQNKLKKTKKSKDTPKKYDLVSFGPALPVLALAQFLLLPDEKKYELAGGNIAFKETSTIDALRTAATLLISHDRLFCLSLFFGVPLIDRTNTLQGALCMKTLVRSVPTKDEINNYRQDFPQDAHEALEKTMLLRAKDIWNKANGREVIVCFSGGIDSTALSVALIRTMEDIANSKLAVTYDDESISENRLFYESCIKKNSKIREIYRDGRTVSEIAKAYPKALIITGELGDQLFGSDKMKEIFQVDSFDVPKSDDEVLKKLGLLNDNTIEYTLDQPWRVVLLEWLHKKGLLAGNTIDWVTWITPQINKAPFPIITLADMLWWLNFSMKWQNVSLRFMHDGGDYKPVHSDISILHFYDDRNLECWACVPDFHAVKFKDLNIWQTYKEPLKKFILDFHPDTTYYNEKEKVGSLALQIEKEKEERIDSIIAIIETETNTLDRLELDPLQEGVYEHLNKWILRKTGQEQVTVNDWNTNTNDAFDAAPYFASDDERQRRHFNPVTLTTLKAKCSALLPPDIVKGNRILDLGACTGAMVHWCLFHGAKEAIALEPQIQFCERMTNLLERSKHSWPRAESCSSHPQERYSVVCLDAKAYLSKCEDDSFDVVIAAGVLHCFSDPTAILREICRVSKKAVVIESVHTMLRRKGVQSPGLFSNIIEFSPNAAVNKAGEDASFSGSAAIPTKELVTSLVTSLGFTVTDTILSSEPGTAVDVASYCENKAFESSPLRFFLRCYRTHNVKNSPTLENVVMSGKGNVHKWEDTKSHMWTSFEGFDKDNIEEKKEQNDIVVSTSMDISMPNSFISWQDIHTQASEISFDASNDLFPYSLHAWGKNSGKRTFRNISEDHVTYGYIFEGNSTLSGHPRRPKMTLCSGMFFCQPGNVVLERGSGIAITVPIHGNKNRFLFSMGGPIEEDKDGELVGALPYIDGCTDSLLISPPIKGDPCLNHLHFPTHIKQTQHTHPSGRAGMVIAGEGNCVVVHGDKSVTRTKLTPGTVFVIPTNAPHAFETEDSTLDVIAFHPDSDFGAEATNHPMVNRTIVNGISASVITSIQTKMMT